MIAHVKENYSEPKNTYQFTVSIPIITSNQVQLIMQRLMGFILFALGIAVIIFFNEDAGVSIWLILAGIAVMFTKENFYNRR